MISAAFTMQVPFGPKVRLGWQQAPTRMHAAKGASKDFEGVWVGRKDGDEGRKSLP